jgi:hypothetical protein
LRLARSLQPLARLGEASGAAALLRLLASDASRGISGQAVARDGGMAAGPSLGALAPLYALAALGLLRALQSLSRLFVA